MAQLSELDVQNLRHLIGGSETCHAKFSVCQRKQTAAYGILEIGGTDHDG